MIAYCLNPNNRPGTQHWVTGADASGGVTFSENPADALLFPDAPTATAFATGKNVFGAVQVTVSGLKNRSTKSNNN